MTSLGGARSGSVSVVAAICLPLLIAMVALVAEYGYGLHCKAQDQRVADLAAYAGAVVYGSTSSTATMNAVIANVGVLNGVQSSSVSGSLVSSPTGDGNQAVLVRVNTTAPLELAQIFGGPARLPIAASAYAELKANSSGCIIALDGAGAGIALSGGTAVKAPTCAVASNAAVSAPCGTTITSTQIDYNSSSPPSAPCGGIVAPSGQTLRITKTVTADPLVANSGVLAANAHIASVANLASPAGPGVTGGVAVDFGYSTNSTQAQLAADGCTGVYAANTWTVTCAGAGPFHFGNITTGGGISVNFNTGGSASAVYDFGGYIYNTGSAMAFGRGTFNINQGIITGGGTTTTFGAGTFNIGRGSGGCNGSSGYSICHSGALLAFNGPSTFVTQGGIYNGGGSKLVLGAGSSNSFNIGAANDGDAFVAAGGATTTFADATGPGDLFEMAGALDVVSGGGSCLTLSAAAQHDINGNFATAGGTLLGPGVYTVNGYIGLGANGGGDVTCGGTDLGLSGTGVTLVASGAQLIPGGTCSGLSFCIAAGFNSVTLTAPSSGATAGLVVVGPTTGSHAGASFAEGASGTSLSGTLYFPAGGITLGGGASVGNGPGQCLELIGSQVTLTGGALLASSCFSDAGSLSAVVLVQ